MSAFTTYAQNFEDVMLWRALRHVERGFYIDVGANDPIVDSVSKAFYELGWRGIHVEPVSEYADRLRQDRPDEVVIEAALGSDGESLTLFEVQHTGMSTAIREFAEKGRARGFVVTETKVPCLRLDDVLAQAGDREVHWLKIDVEGFEGNVLAGWSCAKRPWIVVVEATIPMSQVEAHEAWESMVLSKGYKPVFADGLNRYYLSLHHQELEPAFRFGPNVFDDFHANETVWITQGVKHAKDAVIAGVRAEIAALSRSLDTAQDSLSETRRASAELQAELAAARAEAAALSESRNGLVRQIQLQARASRVQHGFLSWRLTLPLRRLEHWIGSGGMRLGRKVADRASLQDSADLPDSIEQLLQLDDDPFVRAAYWTILGREADHDGFAHHMRHLQQGRSRNEILTGIRTSPEGRAREVYLQGFGRILWQHRLLEVVRRLGLTARR